MIVSKNFKAFFDVHANISHIDFKFRACSAQNGHMGMNKARIDVIKGSQVFYPSLRSSKLLSGSSRATLLYNNAKLITGLPLKTCSVNLSIVTTSFKLSIFVRRTYEFSIGHLKTWKKTWKYRRSSFKEVELFLEKTFHEYIL